VFVRSVLSQSVSNCFYLVNVQYLDVSHVSVYSRGFQTVVYWTMVRILGCLYMTLFWKSLGFT
jgi:hypothetical protein